MSLDTASTARRLNCQPVCYESPVFPLDSLVGNDYTIPRSLFQIICKYYRTFNPYIQHHINIIFFVGILEFCTFSIVLQMKYWIFTQGMNSNQLLFSGGVNGG